MLPRMLLLVFVVAVLGSTSTGAAAAAAAAAKLGNDTLTAYELLEQYGFPQGLLPSNVKDYSLESNGKFVLHLAHKCDVSIPDEYPVRYETKISGTLSYGSVEDLSGVSVKVLFVWWDLTGIHMAGSKVVFEVGLLSASYPASNFEESPDCGSSVSLSSAA